MRCAARAKAERVTTSCQGTIPSRDDLAGRGRRPRRSRLSARTRWARPRLITRHSSPARMRGTRSSGKGRSRLGPSGPAASKVMPCWTKIASRRSPAAWRRSRPSRPSADGERGAGGAGDRAPRTARRRSPARARMAGSCSGPEVVQTRARAGAAPDWQKVGGDGQDRSTGTLSQPGRAARAGLLHRGPTPRRAAPRGALPGARGGDREGRGAVTAPARDSASPERGLTGRKSLVSPPSDGSPSPPSATMGAHGGARPP